VDNPALMRIARTVLPGYINNSPAMIVICSDLDRVALVMGARPVRASAHQGIGLVWPCKTSMST
jgi:hypothetical protein